MSEDRIVTPQESADEFLDIVTRAMAGAVVTGQSFAWQVTPDGRCGCAVTLTIDPLLPAFVPDGDTTDFGDHP